MDTLKFQHVYAFIHAKNTIKMDTKTKNMLH